MSNTRKIDAKSLIANAKRPERSVTVNLRGDLIAQIQDLEAELRKIQQRDTTTRLVDHPDAVALAEQIHALESEADESLLALRFRALSGPEWRRAITAHPPTAEQREEGYIADSNAVAEAVFRDSLVDPDLDDDDVSALHDALTEGQWAGIVNTIFQLNGGDNTVPFSQIASLVHQNSADGPKSPGPGA